MDTDTSSTTEYKLISEGVQSLHQGQIFANYGELCDALGICAKNNTSRKYQMQKILSFVSICKNKHALVISEIHYDPCEVNIGNAFFRTINQDEWCKLADTSIDEFKMERLKLKQRSSRTASCMYDNMYDKKHIDATDTPTNILKRGRKPKYQDHIKNVILHQLKINNGTLICSTFSLWSMLGFINNNYNLDNDLFKSEIYLTTHKFNINKFKMRCSLKFQPILKCALDRMKSDGYISYDKVFFLKFDDNYVEATNTQEKIILDAQDCVLESLGMTSFRDVILKKQQNKFYSEMSKRVSEVTCCKDLYSNYKIIYTGESKINVTSEEAAAARLSLNRLIYDFLNNQAKKQYDKNGFDSDRTIERICDTEDLTGQFFYPKDYVEKQVYLADKLIKIF